MDKGFRQSYKADIEQSLSVRVVNIGHERCSGGQKWGPGVRNFYLLHHVISGKGYYIAGDKKYIITAGKTFIIYQDTPITYFADNEDPWEYYWVGFKGNDAGIILDKSCFSPQNLVVDINVENDLKELLSKIYEHKGKDEAEKIVMSGYLMLVLSLFIRKNDNSSDNISVVYCKKAAEYIANNYQQNLNISGISSYIGLSRSQLYRVFMEVFNMSPARYITEYRIDQASRLLKNTGLTIGEVGNSAGFADNLYFSRVFRKIKGISPSEYRNSLCE